MRSPRAAALPVALAMVAVAASCAPPDPGRPDFVAQAYLRVVAAEDTRPSEGPALAILFAAESSPSPQLRAAAVRGLGRLEDPGLAARITPLLTDPDRRVRREAANALAQAVHRGEGTAALPHLLAAARRESDPGVLGAVARSLGRLRLPPEEGAAVAHALTVLSRTTEGDAPPYQMEGVVLGMASLVRQLRGAAVPEGLHARLGELTAYGSAAPPGDRGAARVRGVAVATWLATGLHDGEVELFLKDGADEVRRVAAARLGALPAPLRPPLAGAALGDPAPQVRLEAVRRGLGTPPLSGEACALLLATAGSDPSTAVRLAALDALASPCPDRTGQMAGLSAWAGSGAATDPVLWHVGAHALAALAAVDAPAARTLLPVWVDHPSLFARTWVATAAARVGSVEVLRTLALDAHPNVRTEALVGLSALLGRGADPDLVSALRVADDNQLLLTVAGLLEGAGPRTEIAQAALDALERISRPGWETLRDARVALLALAGHHGRDGDFASAVRPWLEDHDPVVAQHAAAVLKEWTGRPWTPAPRPAPPLPLPTEEELAAMETATLVFQMAGGGAFHVRLLPWQAPTNAVRLYRQALEGTLDGLTLHRVVPNFVVQGGSPGANEFAGHGTFTRDEVGLASNWRGTVGLSTRGRDTGDGQLYVNLVDNVRLDHEYTVFGTVVEGMSVLDGILEGAVIEAVRVRPAPAATAGPGS